MMHATIMVMIGVAVGVSGTLYEMRALTAASVLFFGAAAVCFVVPWPWLGFLLAAVVAVGYIGPGVLMLRQRSRPILPTVPEQRGAHESTLYAIRGGRDE